MVQRVVKVDLMPHGPWMVDWGYASSAIDGVGCTNIVPDRVNQRLSSGS